VAILAILACGGFAEPLPARLEVVDARGAVVWRMPTRAGAHFDLAFTHSAEHCRWTHHYSVSLAEGIVQHGSTFPCIGAGMPTASSDGTPVRLTPQGFEVSMPMVLGELHMINSRPAEIKVRVDGRDFPIGDWLPDMAPFVVRAR
jgi:hypothetical protein